MNEYIKEITGGDFSAKTFRTWSATVLAAVGLASNGREARTKTARKRAVSAAVKEVSRYLGNTPAVCRASYIDPRVIDRYQSGWTIAESLAGLADPEEEDTVPDAGSDRKVERAVLDLIAGETDSPVVAKTA